MIRVFHGDRPGRKEKIRLGCSTIIFDENKENVLLTRSTDNGKWCLPNGGVEPGESVSEACEREVREEIGLWVRIERLVGVYSDPNYLIKYTDGNCVQIIALNFEATRIGGEIGLSEETKRQWCLSDEYPTYQSSSRRPDRQTRNPSPGMLGFVA